MIEKDKIRKGLGPRREAPCIELLRDIVIPAGTMLRQSKPDTFEAPVGVHGRFSIFLEPGDELPAGTKRVISV